MNQLAIVFTLGAFQLLAGCNGEFFVANHDNESSARVDGGGLVIGRDAGVTQCANDLPYEGCGMTCDAGHRSRRSKPGEA